MGEHALLRVQEFETSFSDFNSAKGAQTKVEAFGDGGYINPQRLLES